MVALETQINTARTWNSGWQITLRGEIGRWDALNLDEDLLDAFDEGALLPPATLHTFIHGDPREPLTAHFFRFELLRDETPVHLASSPLVLEAAPSLREYLEPLHDDRAAGDEDASIRIKARLVVLLSSAFRIFESSIVGGTLTYAQRHLLYKMLAERRGERVRPTDLAYELGLSPDYFTRLFGRTFGVPPRRWLIEQRIDDAANILLDSTLTVSQVAHELGYRDVYEFSRQFKQILGMSPRSYRRRKDPTVVVGEPAAVRTPTPPWLGVPFTMPPGLTTSRRVDTGVVASE